MHGWQHKCMSTKNKKSISIRIKMVLKSLVVAMYVYVLTFDCSLWGKSLCPLFIFHKSPHEIPAFWKAFSFDAKRSVSKVLVTIFSLSY